MCDKNVNGDTLRRSPYDAHFISHNLTSVVNVAHMALRSPALYTVVGGGWWWVGVGFRVAGGGRSTTGSILLWHGASTTSQLSLSERQSCVSHSTPYADMVAMCTTLEAIALPRRMISEEIGQPIYICVCIYTHTHIYIYIYICIFTPHSDNEVMLIMLLSGQNPRPETLRQRPHSSGSIAPWVLQIGVCQVRIR